MKNALVIGFGSIGKLHCNILEQMGFRVSVVSKHNAGPPQTYSSLADACKVMPDYVVIASQTSDHESHLRELREVGYDGKVLVEKPLFATSDQEPVAGSGSVFVGYNLRYHPCTTALVDSLAGKKVLTVHHYVGQHLSLWRPGSNHLESYSANKALGGGVLRDLSHELDLMNFLFGPPELVKAIGGRFGTVTNDAEVAYGLVMKTAKCPLITLQMNCLDHFGLRQMKVVCEDTSFDLDFTHATFRSGKDTQSFQLKRGTSYRLMHEDILDATVKQACSYEQGLRILKQIEDLENT